ncbi:hypothetical protein HBH70_200680 [Parastagonospora nodorum]|nr:hypothetical protein HBH53_192980 [Parastagonospora nodorum]KAH4043898.1 hypothetical protein HBH49_227760 [Parastagonospora nodorum]KAH4095270.1 hypothetical protein HBH46_172060 [Parastagonospora nodorum]KAH5129894.1 hypothetical protein HBH70_200680 [Parastagonospora nodorum]KAH6088853.1 hypothetical protein HBI65_173410 [Parastagonospora nodorum]
MNTVMPFAVWTTSYKAKSSQRRASIHLASSMRHRDCYEQKSLVILGDDIQEAGLCTPSTILTFPGLSLIHSRF